MAKHKPMCLVVMLLVVVGAVNWGLVGLGGLLNVTGGLNVVHMILGSLPAVVESIVYLLVGLAGLMLGYITLTMKECGCEKMK